MTVIGLAAPYDRPARNVDTRGAWYTVTVRRGAFTRAIADPRPVPLCTNHHDVNVLAPRVQLFENHCGLYLEADVDERLFGLIVDDVVGLSIGFDGDVSAWSRPPARAQTIIEIPRLREISLAFQTPPVFPSTWVARDTPAARRRIELEDLEACKRELRELQALAS